MPAASANVMASFVTLANASALPSSSGFALPISLNASTTWLALCVVVAPRSMAYCFSAPISLSPRPVSAFSWLIDFSKPMAVCIESPKATAALAVSPNDAARLPRLPTSPVSAPAGRPDNAATALPRFPMLPVPPLTNLFSSFVAFVSFLS